MHGDVLRDKLTMLVGVARILRGVCFAAARAAGHTVEDLERARQEKAARRGRFERGYIWEGEAS